MKKSHAFLIGFGCVLAAGIPIGWSVYSVQRMQNEIAVVRAAAQTAEQEKAAAEAKAAEETQAREAAEEKAREEQLEQQRQLAKEIAEERAQKLLEENTATAWNQFLTTLDKVEGPADESISPEDAIMDLVSSLDAIPTGDVDTQAVSMIQSVQSVFEDLHQRILQYDKDLKALAERTPGTNLSAGLDGCGVATDLLNTDNSILNLAGCALGLATGAGISNENLTAAARQLDNSFEQDTEAILDRLLSMEEQFNETVSHLSSEYDIVTPEKYL